MERTEDEGRRQNDGNNLRTNDKDKEKEKEAAGDAQTPQNQRRSRKRLPSPIRKARAMSYEFKENDLTCLADELLLHVFSFLDCKDLCCVSCVCRRWRVLADDTVLWDQMLSFLCITAEETAQRSRGAEEGPNLEASKEEEDTHSHHNHKEESSHATDGFSSIGAENGASSGGKVHLSSVREGKKDGLTNAGTELPSLSSSSSWSETASTPSAQVIYYKGPNGERMFKAASLDALIDIITSPAGENYIDLNEQKAFLETYLSFTTPEELLVKIIRLYDATSLKAKRAARMEEEQLKFIIGREFTDATTEEEERSSSPHHRVVRRATSPSPSPSSLGLEEESINGARANHLHSGVAPRQRHHERANTICIGNMAHQSQPQLNNISSKDELERKKKRSNSGYSFHHQSPFVSSASSPSSHHEQSNSNTDTSNNKTQLPVFFSSPSLPFFSRKEQINKTKEELRIRSKSHEVSSLSPSPVRRPSISNSNTSHHLVSSPNNHRSGTSTRFTTTSPPPQTFAFRPSTSPSLSSSSSIAALSNSTGALSLSSLMAEEENEMEGYSSDGEVELHIQEKKSSNNKKKKKKRREKEREKEKEKGKKISKSTLLPFRTSFAPLSTASTSSFSFLSRNSHSAASSSTSSPSHSPAFSSPSSAPLSASSLLSPPTATTKIRSSSQEWVKAEKIHTRRRSSTSNILSRTTRCASIPQASGPCHPPSSLHPLEKSSPNPAKRSQLGISTSVVRSPSSVSCSFSSSCSCNDSTTASSSSAASCACYPEAIATPANGGLQDATTQHIRDSSSFSFSSPSSSLSPASIYSLHSGTEVDNTELSPASYTSSSASFSSTFRSQGPSTISGNWETEDREDAGEENEYEHQSLSPPVHPPLSPTTTSPCRSPSPPILTHARPTSPPLLSHSTSFSPSITSSTNEPNLVTSSQTKHANSRTSPRSTQYQSSSYFNETTSTACLPSPYSFDSSKALITSNTSTDIFAKQVRICAILKKLIDRHFEDFGEVVVNLLRIFIRGKIIRERTPINVPMANSIVVSITNKLNKKKKSYAINFPSLPPDPQVPLNICSVSLTLFDVPDLEIARQLTIVEFERFAAIKTSELFGQPWSSRTSRHKAPNVMRMINAFNSFSMWVATIIVKQEKIKDRIKVMERFIYIAHHLYKLNNFNTLMAILAGLQHGTVYRLAHTRQEISKKSERFFRELNALMKGDNSYKTYRVALRERAPPCIPYLGVHLSDLTFIEDGNPDHIKGLINFHKRRLVYRVLSEIMRYQQTPYNLTHVPQILPFITNFQPMADEELYALSSTREPRHAERKDLL